MTNWKRVTEYMIKTRGSVRRDIKAEMKQYVKDDKKAKNIFDKLGTDADCSCNDYHYSQQGLIYLQKKQTT